VAGCAGLAVGLVTKRTAPADQSMAVTTNVMATR
jgi:hypothetical protein